MTLQGIIDIVKAIKGGKRDAVLIFRNGEYCYTVYIDVPEERVSGK